MSSEGAHFNAEEFKNANPNVSVDWAISAMRGGDERKRQQMKAQSEYLNEMWAERKDKSLVYKQFRDFLTGSDNPYVLVVFLLNDSPDLHVHKMSTFSYGVCKEFEGWLSSSQCNIRNKSQILTPEVKLDAVRVSTR